MELVFLKVWGNKVSLELLWILTFLYFFLPGKIYGFKTLLTNIATGMRLEDKECHDFYGKSWIWSSPDLFYMAGK